MISIIEELPISPLKGRHPSPLIAGKGKTLGDLVNPLVDDSIDVEADHTIVY